jgi:hypothetical protein
MNVYMCVRVQVCNLSEHGVRSLAETIALLQTACRQRTMGETKMNATSSRSHAIFTVTLTQAHAADE